MKIFLGVLGVVAFVGICFGCLAVYAKKEINKPKFVLPEIAQEQVKSELPQTKEEAFDYVNGLIEKCVSADNIELSVHRNAVLSSGERKTPLSETDNAVFSRVLEQTQSKITSFYPVTENVLITDSDNELSLGFTKADVTDFVAERGYKTESGETVDDGLYYITLIVKPNALDINQFEKSEIKDKVISEIKDVASVSSLEFEPVSFEARFRVDYADDLLNFVEIKQVLSVKAAVDFVGEYKALSDKTAEFEIPLEKTTGIDLFHYGLRFTERQIALQVGKTEALPLDVRVNSKATKENYSLIFEVSEDGLLNIDADGVVESVGASENPVTVTAKLEYGGHTYTDELIVYSTDLEVKTDEP